MYLALGIIFMAVALGIAAAVGYTMVRSLVVENELISKKNIWYLAPVLALVYLLYVTAAVYAKKDIDFLYLFTLIDKSLDLFKFEVADTLIAPIIDAYPVFYADFVIACLLCMATVILSVASLFGKSLSHTLQRRRLFRRDCDIVIGDSSTAVEYAKNNPNTLLWCDGITRRRYAELKGERLIVVRAPMTAEQFDKKIKRGVHHIIAFRDGKAAYTDIIEMFAELKTGRKRDVFLHLEANQEETKAIKEKLIPRADVAASSCITCFGRHDLIARKFVWQHPITKYIPRSFYNDNYSLKFDKQINVVFIGFGRVNYQLFRMCAMQFQFAEQRGDRLASKPVRYYIYDNNEKRLHNEFFSRIDYEFDEVFKNCDFEKPEKICELHVADKTDINSVKAKREFNALVGENSFTYFIVSLDNDLEDASYARTLERIIESKGNHRIFVRAKNVKGEKLNDDGDSIVYFGEDCGYTHENITHDEIAELAQKINLLYSYITDPPEELKAVRKLEGEQKYAALERYLSSDGSREYMREAWERLKPIEQQSNFYHALGLPFKLGLLGMGLERSGSARASVDKVAYGSRYFNPAAKNFYPDYAFYFQTYSSNVLAYAEHSRWNALYILYDYSQMNKADMHADGKGGVVHKDTERKRHGCITTYYGLDALVRFKFGLLYPEENFDKTPTSDERILKLGEIYKYDYMDLDRLYEEISAVGYKIVDELHD